MQSLIGRRSVFFAAVAAAVAAGAGSSHAGLDAPAASRLAALRQAPDSAGVRIYGGVVHAKDARGSDPLFSYERRVGEKADGNSSSAHITRDPQGRVIIAEQAEFAPGYALQRFDAIHQQLGYSGSVVLSNGGRHLVYELDEHGKRTTATEDVGAPVVAGPTLHGFILHHWDALAPGQALGVRMIVMAKKTTYGFDIRRLPARDGHTTFTVTPSSWLVRLAVAPLTVTFDATTRNVVRYEGQVPPMRQEAGRLKTLVARVDYAMAVPVYR